MPLVPSPRPLVRRTLPTALLTIGLATGSALLATSPGEAAPETSTRWIVRFQDQRTMQQAGQAGGSSAPRHTYTQVFPGMATSMTAREARQLRTRPGVVSVTPDRRMAAADVQVNPPRGLDRIDQRSPRPSRSYTSTMTGKGVTIYVADSGLNLGHTDFTGRVVNGPNFDAPGTAPSDCSGHGTHVTGIAAGTRHGVAKQARIIPIKVLSCDGGGFESDTIAAMDWVVKHHKAGQPAVLNMSLTGLATPEVTAAARRVLSDGVTLVTAAGNAPEGGTPGDACQFGPGNVAGALTVGNASANNWQNPTSNFGRCVDLFAPGTDITSTWIGDRKATWTNSGTSMATPFVTGAAALVLQARPAWTPTQVSNQILTQSQKNVILGSSPSTSRTMLNTLSPVTPGAIEKIGILRIKGTPRVGSTLSSTAGSWGNGQVQLKRAWYRVDRSNRRTLIAGATGSTYRVTSADRGYVLQLFVTGSKPNYASRTTYSPKTGTVS